jgi:hypothetical protein
MPGALKPDAKCALTLLRQKNQINIIKVIIYHLNNLRVSTVDQLQSRIRVTKFVKVRLRREREPNGRVEQKTSGKMLPQVLA